MTDEQIIKALETHLSNEGECSECAYFENIGSCVGIMHKDLYDLINRQKAEVENQSENFKRLVAEHRKLQTDYSSMQSTLAKMSMGVEQAKAEAIKEFAEAFKVKFAKERYRDNYVIDDEMLDNLVKEMAGEG